MTAIPGDCTAYAEDLSAFLDGELDPARLAAVTAHLDGCPACSAHCARLRAVDTRLRGLRSPRVPAGLEERLLARIAGEAPATFPRTRRGAPRRRSRLAPALTAIVMAAAAAVALYLGVVRSPSPRAPETVARQDVRGSLPPKPAPARPHEAALADADLDSASEEDLSVAIDLETLQDLDVIANLDALERMGAQGRKDHG